MFKHFTFNLQRIGLRTSSSVSHVNTKVCIVGSGPAGFYTAQHLIKNNSHVEIDMYEKLPVPFGLVRYGVAPDHPDVKNVINTFTNIAKSGRLQFIGNVNVGQDVTLSDLRNAYNVVVLAYGAAQDRWLGVPGETSKNVISARKFVGWYNGLPEDRNIDINLDVQTAVIIGHGNVALDIARILLTPVDVLRKTDIAQHALEALSASKVKDVKIVGRRGPLQVAFTIKELRELTQLPLCNGYVNIDNDNKLSIEKLLPDLSRPRKRITELMLRNATFKKSNEDKQWEMLFCRTPTKITANDSDHVNGIVFGLNRLEGTDFENPTIVSTGLEETVPCGIVVKSIGYKSLPLADELPFDHIRGVIRQSEGRVDGLPGVYCSGWVASGPTGVIASTLQSGHDVGRRILQDLSGTLVEYSEPKLGSRDILPKLRAKGVNPVTFYEWEKLDQEEQERGKQYQKPREKIVDVKEMFEIIKKN